MLASARNFARPTWSTSKRSRAAYRSLVNNLDLEVVGPGGTYLGNVFTAGISTTGGTADVRNTVEQFRLIARSRAATPSASKAHRSRAVRVRTPIARVTRSRSRVAVRSAGNDRVPGTDRRVATNSANQIRRCVHERRRCTGLSAPSRRRHVCSGQRGRLPPRRRVPASPILDTTA